ncbi:hypothetical protein [Paenibacillus tundrae]
MDFRLSVASDLPREVFRKILYDMICEVFFVELINYEVEVRDRSGAEQVIIGCTYFSLSIDLDEEEDYIKRFREMNLEDHGVDTNVPINIQFISRTFDIGWLKMLEVVGKLLELNDKDLLFEDDTSYPLIKRIKGELQINTHSDERQANYLAKESLALLNYPYEEEDFFKNSEE